MTRYQRADVNDVSIFYREAAQRKHQPFCNSTGSPRRPTCSATVFHFWRIAVISSHLIYPALDLRMGPAGIVFGKRCIMLRPRVSGCSDGLMLCTTNSIRNGPLPGTR